MRLFGKSVASKYEEIEASIGEAGVLSVADPVTWAALRLATQEWRQAYLPDELANKLVESIVLGDEPFQLVNHGYILGRIEVKNEGKKVGFSSLPAGDSAYEAGEFAMVAARAIGEGISYGEFSGRSSHDVSELISQFAIDAAQFNHILLDDTVDDDHRLQGRFEACNTAVYLGREIAIIEDIYTNPKKRRELKRIREKTIHSEQRHSFEEIQRGLGQEGIETPSEWADQLMRRVNEQFWRRVKGAV